MNYDVILCHVVAFIMLARHLIMTKLKLLDSIAQPVETNAMAFVRRGAIVLLTTPSAVVLSVWTGVGSWGWPFQLEYAGKGLLRGN